MFKSILAVLISSFFSFNSLNITLVVDGVYKVLETNNKTVETLLEENNVILDENDWVNKDLSSTIEDNDEIIVIKAQDRTILNDENIVEKIKVPGETLSEVWSFLDKDSKIVNRELPITNEVKTITFKKNSKKMIIDVDPNKKISDYIQLNPLDTVVSYNNTIEIIEETRTYKKIKEKIEFSIEESKNEDLLVGEKDVSQKGVNGEESFKIFTITKDNKETFSYKESISKKEPINETIIIGTIDPTDEKLDELNLLRELETFEEDGVFKTRFKSKPVEKEIIIKPVYEENVTPAISGNVADYQNYAKESFSKYGWSEDNFSCIVNLWDKESGWNPSASNSSSGAYGIPQSLPGSKMSSHGDDWQINYKTQINWGLDYISGRYETPCGAWNFFTKNNWY